MNQFNVRVYGLLINDKNEILVSDELRSGFFFSKFPGGGVEFGEGIKDALIREFQEEIGIEIEVQSLFYVNDHLQISAFNSNHQLLSFYYFVSCNSLNRISNESYEIPLVEEGEKQRWVPIDIDLENYLTFPLDKIVAQNLLKL